jgi:4-hydroxy-3-methylbut-2-enyl diphosphate reductase
LLISYKVVLLEELLVIEKSLIMGYCNGVAHVIEIAQECLRIAKENNLPAYSIGWFIHNPNVVKRFADAGMQHIDRPEDNRPGVALIRAHGIGDPLRAEFIEAGFKLLDGTCGTVAYSQRIIRTSNPDWHVVIAGLPGHSEVDALSHVWNSHKEIVPVSVIETVEDVENLPSFGNETVMFMTQTTFPIIQYDLLKGHMEAKYGTRLQMGNRLCPTTSRRLEAINILCTKVDAVIVIGGKMSANTMALVHVVEKNGLPVWHIEDAREIPQEVFTYERVGITAGTSTPPEDIDAVYDALKSGASDE